MKDLYHKSEEKSVEIQQTFVPQSLAYREDDRLRKILYQDLLSKNDPVILLVEVLGTAFLGRNSIVS